MRRLLVAWLAVATLGLSAGCDDGGDGDGDADTDVDGDGDSDVDTDADSDTDSDSDGDGDASLTVEVVAVPPTWGEAEETEGAIVAFDRPDGERVEGETGADGRVTFEGFDWGAGEEAALTAYAPGRMVLSLAELTEEAVEERVTELGAYRMLLVPMIDPEDLVQVGGEATNMVDEEHTLLVSSTVTGIVHEATGPAWSVGVLPGVAFQLVAAEIGMTTPSTVSSRGMEFEIFAWSVVDQGAVTEPTDVEIDMSETVTSTTVAGSYAIPEHDADTFFDRGWGYSIVQSLDSGETTWLGGAHLSDVNEDGTAVEYEIEHIELEAVERPVTVYMMLSRTTSEGSGVIVPGYPVAGEQDIVLLTPPVVTTPAGRDPIAIDQDVVWELGEAEAAAPDLHVNLRVFPADEFGLGHACIFPPGTTSGTVPQLPTGVDPAEVYGPERTGGMVQLCEPDEDEVWCLRNSSSRTFEVQR